MSGLLKKIQTAHLCYFEFPGGGYSLEVLGLDEPLACLGLSPIPTPRHADLLFIVGPVPEQLTDSLQRIYAEIPRPRYAIAIGCEPNSLPFPVDAVAGFDTQEVEDTIRDLRERIASGYQGAPPLEEPREEDGHEDHGDHDHGEHDHAHHDGHDTDSHDEHAGNHGHGGHDEHGHGNQGGHDHHMHMMGAFQESEDGLALEWITMPLGPVHPATPGGLGLTVTLDGDLVAGTSLDTGYLARGILDKVRHSDPQTAPGILQWLDPRTPVSPPTLVAHILEDLAAVEIPEPARFGRVYLLELERVASHLGWLAGMARALGAEIAATHAFRARRPILPTLRRARVIPGGLGGELAIVDLAAVRDAFTDARRLLGYRDWLAYRLEGLAVVGSDARAAGPVIRASGRRDDARLDDSLYQSLGFEPVTGEWGDALARYEVRVREIEQSLRLAEAVVERSATAAADWQIASGQSTADLEGPRGRARATLHVADGGIHHLDLRLPSQVNVELVPDLIQGVSLSDAVAAIWSLDLSAEEIDADG